MSENAKQVKLVLETYGLTDAHVDYCRESFTELRPKYHNEEHCYSTALTFHALAQDAGIEIETARNGFVAGLYHDAAHRMAKRDDVNIKSALAWINRASFFEDSIDVVRVKRFIEATHNENEHFRDKAELLLHDADILQTVKGSLVENLVWQARLAEEFACAITQDGSIDFALKSVRCPEAAKFLRKQLAAYVRSKANF